MCMNRVWKRLKLIILHEQDVEKFQFNNGAWTGCGENSFCFIFDCVGVLQPSQQRGHVETFTLHVPHCVHTSMTLRLGLDPIWQFRTSFPIYLSLCILLSI